MKRVEIDSKGWGFEKYIVNNDKYCGKLLYFVKGYKCSLHYHKLKDETFYIHKGKVEVWWKDKSEIKFELEDFNKLNQGFSLNSIILEEGDTFHIPQYRVHQIKALHDTELFEFSTPHYESDSYRINKGD